ncbi:hypothetical protein OGAPHI_001872 [Ogataea philodendri]|uniref:Uncharacterized protein n=1 Tax=Ogataea philodendri TaxID=1378263 RepID=A0A9P8T6I2_9ASCO|nr:uncharacterized protein OGAPHI_001872 [Ogataea philodendri]KAH3668118.1 hypothetical protein OGAPHI_001872 [Ogataea philodendri]
MVPLRSLIPDPINKGLTRARPNSPSLSSARLRSTSLASRLSNDRSRNGIRSSGCTPGVSISSNKIGVVYGWGPPSRSVSGVPKIECIPALSYGELNGLCMLPNCNGDIRDESGDAEPSMPE